MDIASNDQLILESLSQPVTLIDKDLNITYSNPARNSYFNSSASNIIGKKCYAVIHGLDNPCWQHGIRYCPAMLSFKKNTRVSATHKHLFIDETVVEKVVSTPFNGNDLVILEYHDINNLLGLKNGILVICASCMRVRDEDGDWCSLDTYLHHQTGADFSHSICYECKHELYPDFLRS